MEGLRKIARGEKTIQENHPLDFIVLHHGLDESLPPFFIAANCGPSIRVLASRRKGNLPPLPAQA